MLLDFGDNLFALVYGPPAGASPRASAAPTSAPRRHRRARRSTASRSTTPAATSPTNAATASRGSQWLLPHVVGPHREIGEQHVFEDIMQLVDWVRDGKPTIVTAEHARHVIDIIESAYRAAETGRDADATTTFD